MLGVPIKAINEAIETYFGSSYVNDFNIFGRTYRVTAQADLEFRKTAEDLARIKVRNAAGDMVPLGNVTTLHNTYGPDRVPRYNLYPASEIAGDTAPGKSSGFAVATMEKLAAQVLPAGIGYEWTDLTYQQTTAGNTGLLIFPLSVLFVYLVLAAQYGSWSAPVSILLIVPMTLLAALVGVRAAGQDVNILTQIGFLVLVGLAAKNAILIVEFARQLEQSRNRAYGGYCRGGPPSSAAHPNDIAGLHSRRRPARRVKRRRGRNASGRGHCRVLRHARGNRVRPAVHAHLLRCDTTP